MIKDTIEAIKAAVNEQLNDSTVLQDVQNIRVRYLGKKGELTSLMKTPLAGRTAAGGPDGQYGTGGY